MNENKELVDGFIQGLESSGPQSDEAKKVHGLLTELVEKGEYDEAASYIVAMTEIFS